MRIRRQNRTVLNVSSKHLFCVVWLPVWVSGSTGDLMLVCGAGLTAWSCAGLSRADLVVSYKPHKSTACRTAWWLMAAQGNGLTGRKWHVKIFQDVLRKSFTSIAAVSKACHFKKPSFKWKFQWWSERERNARCRTLVTWKGIIVIPEWSRVLIIIVSLRNGK